MKIICNTARLNEACQNVQRAVSSKATMPIIEGILMKAADGQVQLTGYDMDMGITTGIAVKMIKVAPLGDPIEVTVRGYQLSLRKEEASSIQVEVV